MKKNKIGIIGLGYVGLPLAVEFSKHYKTIGFDINKERIAELSKFNDITKEVDSNELSTVLNKTSKSDGLYLTNNYQKLKACDIYIITVPTPVNKYNNPNFTPLEIASKTVGKLLDKNNIVIYESTVFPGATEEICVPILEKNSDLKFNKDFFVGYSPERINPGDKNRKLTNIVKITSGSNLEYAQKIDNLYKKIIKAGTHMAPTIKVAEAAKVIENTQRDINIAFVNELSKILSLLDISTSDVLKAASTKWNFLNFQPGLVGGHCIGVDPYYLAQKAIEVGYHPEIILSGRRINDSMGGFVANEIVKKMIAHELKIKKSRALILGITFKENCPDIRNTKVVDLNYALKEFGVKTVIYDPIADKEEVKSEYELKILNDLPNEKFECVVLAVSHKEFKNLNFEKLKKKNGFVYDLKNFIEDNADYKL